MAGPTFLPGETLSAAKLQQLAATSTFTPTLTGSVSNPTLGSGSQVLGWHHVNGRKVDVWFFIKFGTSGVSAGSGIYYVTGPPGYQLLAGFPDTNVGMARGIDNNGTTERALSILTSGNSGTSARVLFNNVVTFGFVADSVPWTWEASDILDGHYSFLTD